jgi:hypothetical protein
MLEISFCLSKEDDTKIKHWLGGLIMTVFTININQKIKRGFFLTVSLFISIIFFLLNQWFFFFKKTNLIFNIIFIFYWVILFSLYES